MKKDIARPFQSQFVCFLYYFDTINGHFLYILRTFLRQKLDKIDTKSQHHAKPDVVFYILAHN